MTEDVHMDYDLPFSAGEGWKQMQTLLDRTLPVRQKNRVRNAILSFLPVLLLSSILLFSYLKLDTALSPATFNNYSMPLNAGITHITSAASQKNSIGNYSKHTGVTSKIANKKNNLSQQTFSDSNEFSLHQNELNKVTLAGSFEKISVENVIKDNLSIQGTTVIQKIKTLPFNTLSPVASPGSKKNQNKTYWNIAAGIGINIMTGHQQNLQPYPVAEFKYHLNSRFFVAAGLSVFSPAPAKVSGINKTVYVNDTVNNISLYNAVTTYDHFHYADIPLSIGLNLSRNFSAQSGLQVSFLEQKKRTIILQSYDFQMNNIDLPPNTPMFGAAANTQQEFDVRVKNIDYRFIAGIRYQLKKMSAGLFYQHTLQPAGSLHNNKTTNQFVTFNLLYQIK